MFKFEVFNTLGMQTRKCTMHADSEKANSMQTSLQITMKNYAQGDETAVEIKALCQLSKPTDEH